MDTSCLGFLQCLIAGIRGLRDRRLIADPWVLESLSPESRRYGLHGNFHTIKGVWFPFPSAGKRGRFFVLAGHCNGHVLIADAFVVRWIEAAPAHAGYVDLRPGVGGAVLPFTHLDIAGHKSRPKTPMPRGFHHEHRVVAAGPGAQSERLAGKLDSGLLATNVFE